MPKFPRRAPGDLRSPGGLGNMVARCSVGVRAAPRVRPSGQHPSFEEFFTENKRRSTLFDARSRTALRRVQPFWLADQARELKIELNDSVDRVAWDELTRLDALWNIDKYRRLTVTACKPFGESLPAYSASVHPFLRSNGANNPRT